MEGLDQFIKDVKQGKMTFSTMSNGLMRSAINEWRPKNVMRNVKITTPPNTFFIPRDRKGSTKVLTSYAVGLKWYFTQLTVTLLNCRKVWSNLSHISSRFSTIFCK